MALEPDRRKQGQWLQGDRDIGGRARGGGRSEGPAITVTASNISGISCDSNDLFALRLADRGWHVKLTMPAAIGVGRGSVYVACDYSSDDCCRCREQLA